MTAIRVTIPHEQIRPNPRNPRKFFGEIEIEELASSIRTRGLLTPPRVRRLPDESYEVIFGGRRLKAWEFGMRKGWLPADMPVDLVEASDRDVTLDAIIENARRVDVSPIEEARSYQAALDQGLTVSELATQIGVMEYRVEERLALLVLDEQAQKLVASGAIAPTTGAVIAMLDNATDRNKVVRALAAGKLAGVQDVRAAVQGIQDARAQASIFDDVPAQSAPSEESRRALSRLERKVEAVIATVGAGFQAGECVAAKQCNPDRLATLAQQLGLLKSTVAMMERQVRDALAQSEMMVA